ATVHTVIPELAYPDVLEATDWLCDAFGFTLRPGIGNHRAQLNVGDGAVVLTERRGRERRELARDIELMHAVMVRVEDVDRHHERAKQRGHGSWDHRPTTHMANGNTPPWTLAATAGRSLSRSPMSRRVNGAVARVSSDTARPIPRASPAYVAVSCEL
ncbi:MAG: VOC family protein, partial [Steroidobacteraceae bacterium]